LLEKNKNKQLSESEIEERRIYMKEYRERKKKEMTLEDIEKRKEYMRNYRKQKVMLNTF
jgi:hypothetical protein